MRYGVPEPLEASDEHGRGGTVGTGLPPDIAGVRSIAVVHDRLRSEHELVATVPEAHAQLDVLANSDRIVEAVERAKDVASDGEVRARTEREHPGEVLEPARGSTSVEVLQPRWVESSLLLRSRC